MYATKIIPAAANRSGAASAPVTGARQGSPGEGSPGTGPGNAEPTAGIEPMGKNDGRETSEAIRGSLGPFDDREGFVVTLLTTLSDVLSEAVGDEDAEGFIALVANALGKQLSERMPRRPGDGHMEAEEVARVLVELKRRIGGGFAVEEVTPFRITLVNSHCPFGAQVIGRPNLCAMTSGVFGRLAADHLGDARVSLPRTIARGDGACRVVIDLDPDWGEEGARTPYSRNYFADDSGADE